MSTVPTGDEMRILRHAAHRGHMFRNARGTVVINPNPRSQINVRYNAKAAAVELCLAKGWVCEDGGSQFHLTEAGQAAKAAFETASPNQPEGTK